MTAMEKKARQAKNELARALAGWDNEGGAAPTKAVGQTKLAKAEERIGPAPAQAQAPARHDDCGG